MVEQPTAPAIPEWLSDEIDMARRLFLVGDDWHLNVQMETNDEADGYCDPDGEYLNATLKFNPGLVDEDEAYRRRVVRHELLHCVLAEVDGVVERLLRELGTRESSLMRQSYREATERAIQRITRGLALYDQRRLAGRKH